MAALLCVRDMKWCWILFPTLSHVAILSLFPLLFSAAGPHITPQCCSEPACLFQVSPLDWAAALDALGIRELTPDALRQTAGFLLKNQEDLEILEQQDDHDHSCNCGGHCGGHHHG